MKKQNGVFEKLFYTAKQTNNTNSKSKPGKKFKENFVLGTSPIKRSKNSNEVCSRKKVRLSDDFEGDEEQEEEEVEGSGIN